MIITNIGRDKSYEMLSGYGLKIWDKVSVSGTISPGEDIQQAYKELDKVLEVAHQTTLAEMEEFKGTKVVDVNPVNTTIQGIIEDIGNCTVVDEKNSLGVQVGLLAYKNIANETLADQFIYPELKAAYDKKLKELQ